MTKAEPRTLNYERGRNTNGERRTLQNGAVRFAIDAVDAHAEGQPGRVVVGGVGKLAAPGETMFEKMKYFEANADWFRLLP